jgi:hypothetical protein
VAKGKATAKPYDREICFAKENIRILWGICSAKKSFKSIRIFQNLYSYHDIESCWILPNLHDFCAEALQRLKGWGVTLQGNAR